MSTADRAVLGPRRAGVFDRYLSLLIRKLASAVESVPPVLLSRLNQFIIDAIITSTSLYIAFQLRFDFNVPARVRVVMWVWMMFLPILRSGVIALLGGYRGIWRYFSMHDAVRLALCSLPTTILLIATRYLLGSRYAFSTIPITVIVIDSGQFYIAAAGVRALRRALWQVNRLPAAAPMRTVIVGTADTLAEALHRVSGSHEIQVVGLVSPDLRLHGLRIGGFSVMSGPDNLPKLLADEGIDLILVSDAGLECLGDIVSTATDFGVNVRLLPTAANIIRGDVRVSALVEPETLFGERQNGRRGATPEVVEAFRGRTVLVTGAGGSIGSEICRQVVQLPVASVVLFDHDENSVFEIHRELRGMSSVELVPKIGDILDCTLMSGVFRKHLPQIVLHAAAYKHVPMMESNSSAAILNNVAGTMELARQAIEHGAERFVMISTDKAVRPSSVMGASKRIAELVVQNIAARQAGDCRTRCGCVRFGNVVGSRGSVVPIFLQQIAAGGPVTITNSEMTRYFMTIPEAVQLVLQAAVLADDAKIYMLDMGDPVKITTLAKKLIEMSGLRPGVDIEVQVVGSRPGEKIFEELWSQGASLNSTMFSRVLEVDESPAPPDFPDALEQIIGAARAREDAVVIKLLDRMQIEFRSHTSAVPSENGNYAPAATKTISAASAASPN